MTHSPVTTLCGCDTSLARMRMASARSHGLPITSPRQSTTVSAAMISASGRRRATSSAFARASVRARFSAPSCPQTHSSTQGSIALKSGKIFLSRSRRCGDLLASTTGTGLSIIFRVVCRRWALEVQVFG